MESAHQLLTWIEANTTQAQFARQCEITAAYLSEILSGRKEPSLKVAARMSRETGGAVPIQAFVKEAAQ